MWIAPSAFPWIEAPVTTEIETFTLASKPFGSLPVQVTDSPGPGWLGVHDA